MQQAGRTPSCPAFSYKPTSSDHLCLKAHKPHPTELPAELHVAAIRRAEGGQVSWMRVLQVMMRMMMFTGQAEPTRPDATALRSLRGKKKASVNQGFRRGDRPSADPDPAAGTQASLRQTLRSEGLKGPGDLFRSSYTEEVSPRFSPAASSFCSPGVSLAGATDASADAAGGDPCTQLPWLLCRRDALVFSH